MNKILTKLKAFLAMLVPFMNTAKVQDRAEDVVIGTLRTLAKQSTNKIDDRLVEAVVKAIDNKSYMTVIRKFKDKK